MKEKIMKAVKVALVSVPFAAVGGYFTGKYAFASYGTEIQQILLEQVGSVQNLAIISMVQSVMYAFVCALVGYLLADKVGLVKSFRIKRGILLKSLLITFICGIAFSLDYWVFGNMIPEVAAVYESRITISNLDNWISSVFYGGIVEELLLRFFLMSLVSLLFWKCFGKKYGKEEIPQSIFVSANILCALLFAAGHIPTTISMFGGVTPIVLFRCFLLNGALGAVFGWMYRKWGIQYAMIGHMGTHIISKIVWLIFV